MGLQNVTVLGSFLLGGHTFEKRVTESANDVFSVSQSIAAAKVGALTTRTDANTGTLTMAADHGITTGARLDLYWAGGCRRGITVGTVSVNEVPIDLGSGDDLPADETAITAMVPTAASFPLTVADAILIGVKCNTISQFTLCEADESESIAFYVEPIAAGQDQSGFYGADFGMTAPAETTITKVYMSHGDSAAAHTMTAAYLAN